MTFSNSHEKTYQVRDSSTQATLKARLLERMKNSKNMVLIISDGTNYDRGMLNFEIEKTVNYYELPLFIAYPEYRSILNPLSHAAKWPKALQERIDSGVAKAMHIPFAQKPIFAAITQFSVHNQKPKSSLSYYKKEAYERWELL